MNRKVVLFTTPNCPSCRAEKQWLADNAIAYDEYDVTDPAVMEEIRNLEQRIQRRLEHVPITVYRGQVYEGFDPATLAEIFAE
jgi:arsenate reductase-like glutaredoxin family protein